MSNPLDNMFWANYQPSVGNTESDRYHALLVDRCHIAALYLFCSTPNNEQCLRVIADALPRWHAALPSESEIDEEEQRRDEAGLPRRPDSDYLRSYAFHKGANAHIQDAQLDSASTSSATFASTIGISASFAECMSWAGQHRWFFGSGYVINGELNNQMLSATINQPSTGIARALLGIDRYVDQASLAFPPPCSPSFVEKFPNTVYHVLHTNYEGNCDDVVLIDGRPGNEQILNKMKKRMRAHAEDDDGWVWQWFTKPKAPVSETDARRLISSKVASTEMGNFPRFTILHGQIDSDAAEEACESGTPFTFYMDSIV